MKYIVIFPLGGLERVSSRWVWLTLLKYVFYFNIYILYLLLSSICVCEINRSVPPVSSHLFTLGWGARVHTYIHTHTSNRLTHTHTQTHTHTYITDIHTHTHNRQTVIHTTDKHTHTHIHIRTRSRCCMLLFCGQMTQAVSRGMCESTHVRERA